MFFVISWHTGSHGSEHLTFLQSIYRRMFVAVTTTGVVYVKTKGSPTEQGGLVMSMFELSILVAGALVCTIIDHAIGIKFNEVSLTSQLVHKTTYMVWGAMIAIAL
jgi:hypothetical protein